MYNVNNIFDGDTANTNAMYGAYSGGNKVNPWVELDLGEIQQVYEVQVYDRADLPKSSTLGIFEVALASTPFPASDKARCGGCRL